MARTLVFLCFLVVFPLAALAQPGLTSAIIGASKPEQLGASLAAAGLRLDEKDREVCNLAWYSLPRPATPVR